MKYRDLISNKEEGIFVQPYQSTFHALPSNGQDEQNIQSPSAKTP